MVGTLLEVEMFKNCTPLWREAHLEVKSVKNCPGLLSFLGKKGNSFFVLQAPGRAKLIFILLQQQQCLSQANLN